MSHLIGFRVDASGVIGTGHLMRCLALADAFRQFGAGSVFVSRHSHPNLQRMVEQCGHHFFDIGTGGGHSSGNSDDYASWLGVSQAQDAVDTLAALSALEVTGLVVDHYALDADWERHFLAARDLHMLAIDDLCRPHAAPLIVDTTYGRTPEDYTPFTGTVLAGSRYALLRPEFAAYRAIALSRRRPDQPVSCLLVAMGGADPDDLSGLLVRALAPTIRARGIQLEVLTGAAYAHADQMQALAATLGGGLIHHHSTSSVAPILVNADLCIGAPGSSSWERCCLGLPTISILMAENQQDISRRLSRAGATADGGSFLAAERVQFLHDLDDGTWQRDIVLPLIDNSEARVRMSRAMADLVDGHGAMRVASRFMGKLSMLDSLQLRPAGPDDSHDIYCWRYAGDAAKYFGAAEVPAFPTHQAWYQAALRDPSRHLLIAQSGETGVAHLRFDLTENGVEISICVSPDLRGKKLGQRALAAAMLYAGSKFFGPITARVHEDNRASVQLFTSAGFNTVTKQGPFLIMRHGGPAVGAP